MTITLSPSSLSDYETFLRIKELPQYRFVGRTAIIPDEYADRLGINHRLPAAGEYRPIKRLFDYQRDISRLAIRKQKFALFVRPGLGKTLMQSEFCRHALARIGKKKALIVSPLMVVPQTIDEIHKFYDGRLPIRQIRASELSDWLTTPDDSRFGITNYEALREETPQGLLGALDCDESSILKSAYGKWGNVLLRMGRGLQWKLCATGTPAPNDRIEYANHSVLLDHFPTINSFLSRFFVNRGETQNRWELKPHALRPFYRALSHWCIFLTNPGAYGWKDNAGTIPPIHVHIDDVPLSAEQQALASGKTGTLFGMASGGITTRSVLGQIAKGRCDGQDIHTEKPAFIRRMVNSWPGESTIIWCRYNSEQDTIEKVFPDAHSMRGETKVEKRLQMIDDFKAGRVKVLISKPDILGWGLNLQIATRQVFSGLEDSYENFTQCIHRSNRVGSTRPLNVHIPVTMIERPMIETVLTKAKRVDADAKEQESMFIESGLMKEVRRAAK